ncbi:hypothetical protein Lser_V15G37512 [Lactuca serriola]
MKDLLTNLLEAHDPTLTLTIRNHLTSTLLPALAILSEMKGVSEGVVSPKQGGESSARVVQPRVSVKAKGVQPKLTTELKANVASASGSKVKPMETIDESEGDIEETIAEALKRRKRDRELDETMKIAKEAEEGERRNKEEEDALQCNKALFPEWTREKLINQAIEFPSVYWLEPVASFDCDNSKDSQFDMPITRKAFTFHCFEATAEVPFPHPKVDRELIDFYLKYGQPQYLTWSAQKIISIKVLKPSHAGRFVNVNFKITRGSANTVSIISLADLPNINPHDCILLFNILLSDPKEYEPVLEHLKRMLASYIHEIATMDQEITKVMNKKPTVKTTPKPGDVNKMKMGQIDSTNLTVMFTKGEAHRFLFALGDKHLFSTDYLEHIINIIHRCK